MQFIKLTTHTHSAPWPCVYGLGGWWVWLEKLLVVVLYRERGGKVIDLLLQGCDEGVPNKNFAWHSLLYQKSKGVLALRVLSSKTYYGTGSFSRDMKMKLMK
jgi:hypothetical protein